MSKTIVTAWVEVHTTDDQLTPEEREASVLQDLSLYARANESRLIVVRTNSFYEPEPTPQTPIDPPVEPEQGTGGDG